MNLKEIRLAGFKSFADKTSIKFEDGVTCIVGPNGCGKSNVADAVRWVLGEQSAKSMRGTSMQDVIFLGTETRHRLSCCEVTLVFDNTTHMFNVENEEVCMTRRLYRSGESEYLLNMQPCRMRDLVELLHDVGIGKEGYSIIGQNRVELIMNSKPEDRRAIFEEATGVMKFKSKRAEIERNLEASREKLSVFVQRMDEAGSRLPSLEKQAETAKKYRAATEELRYEEVNAYLARYENFAAETEQQRERIRLAAERLDGVNTRLLAVDSEDETAAEQIAQADEKLRELNDKLRIYEVGIERKTGDVRVIDEKIGSYRRELDALSDDIEYSLRRTREIDALVAGDAKKKADDQKRAEEIAKECATLSEQLTAAELRLAAIERISLEQRANELSSMENLADARANAGSLAAKRDAAQDRVGEVRDAVAKAQEKRDELTRMLQTCEEERGGSERKLDDMQRESEELKEDVAELSASERKLSQDLVDCNASIGALNNQLEMYRNLKNKFNGYRESVRRLQLDAQQDEELGRRIKGTIADIVSTGKQYEVAIETAFGGAMQNIVTATSQDAKYLIKYLKQKNGGIVTFLPVEAMRPRGNTREVVAARGERGALGLAADLVKYDPYYDNIVRNLLDNTLICDTIDSATAIAEKYPRAFKLVTLDGDQISPSGSMTGGSHRRESANLLAGERQIKECEEEIARRRARAEKLAGAVRSCTDELEAAQKRQEELRIGVQEEAAHFAAICQRQSLLQASLSEAEKNCTEYGALLDNLTRTVDDLESEVLSSKESEDLLDRIRAEAAQEASANAAAGEKLKAERDALQEKLHDLRLEGAALESARAAGEETAVRLSEEKQKLLEKVESSRRAIALAEQEIEKLRREEEQVALTEEEQRAVAGIRARLEDTEAQKKATFERRRALAEEKRGLLARQVTLTEETHLCELEITKTETNLANLQQRIEEAYGLTYETALELRDENYDITKSNANITSLKHRIAAFGDVNFHAEKDYDELLAHYTEMQRDKEDLDKGIVDLSTALDNIKKEMQQRFDDGFSRINENFTHIFRELFGGGRAEMQLDYTNCADPLDAGIEIVACPPGKKLSKISLLSGGERSLTAIAILFSILKSYPMPFCILDEIEAALDDANVDRFANYLKKFAAETQFIVITHRKPTMNQADTLFGVTMEEKGVSKIVSVKLSEVESRLGGDTVQ